MRMTRPGISNPVEVRSIAKVENGVNKILARCPQGCWNRRLTREPDVVRYEFANGTLGAANDLHYFRGRIGDVK